MIKYRYEKVKGFEQKKFLENGHTMFESDVLKRLNRLSYLESENKKSEDKRNMKLRKGILSKGDSKIDVFFHIFGFDSDGESCAVLETMDGDILTEYSSSFKFIN